jgi:hypothetical protein
METTYKGYHIEAYEVEPGRWRVRLRRTDGHRIQVEERAGGVASIKGTGVHSAEDAIAIAMDGGGIG